MDAFKRLQELAEKQVARPGEVREWQAGKFMKMPDGSWRHFPEGHPGHAKAQHFHKLSYMEQRAALAHMRREHQNLGAEMSRLKALRQQAEREYDALAVKNRAARRAGREDPVMAERALNLAMRAASFRHRYNRMWDKYEELGDQRHAAHIAHREYAERMRE